MLKRSAAAIAVHAGTALFRQGRSGDVVISGGVDDLANHGIARSAAPLRHRASLSRAEVQRVPRHHGGALDVHTELGAGSTFYFELPVL